VGGIEIDPLTVAGPAGSATIDARKSGKQMGSAIRDFDDADVVIVLGYRFKGDVATVRRPAGGS
jgi:hypothetical protein